MIPFDLDLSLRDSPKFPHAREASSRRELFRSPSQAEQKNETRSERPSYFKQRADIVPKFTERTDPVRYDNRVSARTSISEERLTPTQDVYESGDYGQRVADLKFRNHSLQSEVEELRNQIAEAERTQSENYELSRRIEQLNEEFELERSARQETFLQKEKALNLMIEDNLKLIENLQSELNKRDSQIKTFERSLQDRTDDNKMLMQENKALRGNLTAAQEGAELSSKELTLKCSKLEIRAARAEEELSDIKRRHSDKLEELASLKASLEETIAELTSLQTSHQGTLMSIQQELHLQRRANAQLTQRLAEAASKQEEICDLKMKLKAHSDVIVSLESDLSAQRDENRKLRRDVDFYRDKENKYETLAGFQRTMEGNSTLISDMSARLNKTSSKVSLLKRNVDRLTSDPESDDSINGEGLSELVKESRKKLGLVKGVVKRKPRRRKL
mmetsp:Transcript_13312/g.25020  ORF Transcript_13312/g.25020 Transcript_13312/m.25020 type:complete len:446 (+) Transcript_13312:195-1532(+)|eukprot:CAMPEP_0204897248 /NCGR_PEP_ID=MMETSP1397-20131031/630_1 /ASSEMBLY_ACC=CAM_ASM_000891 /TAXON_ID=49980 /ORGANISM="Climacostomum Climacostomum virens, Strain Stock W-24" /LENGTH=445 /DNA_ID=CAMNT_0052064969 /DNA_START=30 /DNA_END=1367 /DNA_ORIENTATION=+